MLVLTRKKDESILINGDIEIVVVEIKGDKVKLGIEAPPHISIFRKEVYEEIQAENRIAVEAPKELFQQLVTMPLNTKNKEKSTTDKQQQNNSDK